MTDDTKQPEQTAAPRRGFLKAAAGAGVAATGLLWLVLTAGNAQMANGSSLHSFYRARLNRAYLAVGNPRRGIAVEADDAVHRVARGRQHQQADARMRLAQPARQRQEHLADEADGQRRGHRRPLNAHR